MAYEADWIFLRTAIPELQEYILSNDIFRILRPPSRAPGGVQLSQLSIGNLMLSQQRLTALDLSGPQQDELADLTQQIDQVREEWRANWGIKAEREFASRLNLWQQYLRELRSDSGQQSATFANEVRNRAILRLLRTEIPAHTQARDEEQLNMLDQILRGLSKPGEFVWEQELSKGFPENVFWFLYRMRGLDQP
jgi:hypothetical protein